MGLWLGGKSVPWQSVSQVVSVEIESDIAVGCLHFVHSFI